MSTSNLDISVVICAYTEERWDELVRAIRSLRQQTIAPGEIIIVIDHNRTLFERVRAVFKDAVVVESMEVNGLSGARNQGIRLVRGTVVAFMDEDAAAAPTWLERLAGLYADPRVLGVGGAIQPKWLTGQPSWFAEEFNWVVGCSYRGMPTRTTPVRNLIGCNMSFRRTVFTSIGGFRNGIGRIGTRPVGCEETELCIRIRQTWPASYLLYEPLAQVHHTIPRSRTRWSYFRQRCYAEGLSKALIGRFVGAKDGLAAERSYIVRTLPFAVFRGLSDTLVHGDAMGLLRAGAVVIGLALTTAGYVVGLVSQQRPADLPAHFIGDYQQPIGNEI